MKFRISYSVAAFLMLPQSTFAQLPKDPEERAKVIAQIMQANARQLTLFDREGKELNNVGPKDLYQQPVFSPDATRLAVIKQDLEKETGDLWIFDVATGQGTVSKSREQSTAPACRPMAPRSLTWRCATDPMACIEKPRTEKAPKNYSTKAALRSRSRTGRRMGVI
jgi:hypothetical protein